MIIDSLGRKTPANPPTLLKMRVESFFTRENFTFLAIFIDILTATFTLIVFFLLYEHRLLSPVTRPFIHFSLAYTFFICALLTIFYATRLYDAYDSTLRDIRRSQLLLYLRVTSSTLIATLLLPTIQILFTFHFDLSPMALIYFWIILTIHVSFGKLLFGYLYELGMTKGHLKERIAVVCSWFPVANRLGRLAGNSDDVQWIGVFDDRRPASERTGNQKISGTVSDLAVLVGTGTVDTIIIALPISAGRRIACLARRFQALSPNVKIITEHLYFPIANSRCSSSAETLPLYIFKRPLKPSDALVKMIEDKVIATLGLVFLSPLFIILAMIIKIDSPGPVFFRQWRCGYRNQLISVYKFRTMYAHQGDPEGTRLTERGDRRITRSGRFLRKTSIDELPQLLNVLRGEMSVVGPRPHARAASVGGIPYEDTIEDYPLRHRVKPGITGWAQVNGWRGETNTLEHIRGRVAHDIYYVENWSVLLDIEIILRTAWQLLHLPGNAF